MKELLQQIADFAGCRHPGGAGRILDRPRGRSAWCGACGALTHDDGRTWTRPIAAAALAVAAAGAAGSGERLAALVAESEAAARELARLLAQVADRAAAAPALGGPVPAELLDVVEAVSRDFSVGAHALSDALHAHMGLAAAARSVSGPVPRRADRPPPPASDSDCDELLPTDIVSVPPGAGGDDVDDLLAALPGLPPTVPQMRSAAPLDAASSLPPPNPVPMELDWESVGPAPAAPPAK